MEESIPLANRVTRKISAGSDSGFVDVSLCVERQGSPVTVTTDGDSEHRVVKTPVVKKSSLKKKSSGSVFDGALHMGYLWYFNQNTDKERTMHGSREERLGRILRFDPRCGKNKWRRYFAVIWNDGRFAWYKPEKIKMYNKCLTADLEEVVFVPWREVAFGLDVIRKLCIPREPHPDGCLNEHYDGEASRLGGKIPLNMSSYPTDPEPSWTSRLESATKGLCLCTSPSVVSLIIPVSAATSGASSTTDLHEELLCILPKTSNDSLLIAVAGQDWHDGQIFFFASESQDDLDLWRESFAMLRHRRTVQKSDFDHLVNTPVIITLP